MGAPQLLLETQGGNPGENSHEGLTILIEKPQPERQNTNDLSPTSSVYIQVENVDDNANNRLGELVGI